MMKELAMATLVAGGVCVADATSASLPLAQRESEALVRFVQRQPLRTPPLRASA